MDNLRLCRRCVWHDDFSGACCNGDCKYRGDFTDNDFVCDQYEKRPIRHFEDVETEEDKKELKNWIDSELQKQLNEIFGAKGENKSKCPICGGECLKVSDVYVCGRCFQAVWREDERVESAH